MIGRPDPALELALAERRLREIRQREALAPRYDWFGDECPCGLPLGECREHPRARPAQRPPGFPRSFSDRTDYDVFLLEGGRGELLVWSA